MRIHLLKLSFRFQNVKNEKLEIRSNLLEQGMAIWNVGKSQMEMDIGNLKRPPLVCRGCLARDCFLQNVILGGTVFCVKASKNKNKKRNGLMRKPLKS